MKSKCKSLFQLTLLMVLYSLSLHAQRGFHLRLDFPMLSFPFGDVSFNGNVGLGLRVKYGTFLTT